jgi:hypothetical protein
MGVTPERSPWVRDSDLLTAAELALLGSPRPIALKVSPAGELGVVEVTAGVVTDVVAARMSTPCQAARESASGSTRSISIATE